MRSREGSRRHVFNPGSTAHHPLHFRGSGEAADVRRAAEAYLDRMLTSPYVMTRPA
jgi:hypothetical protein